MWRCFALVAVACAAAGCESEPCFTPGTVEIDVVGTFVVDAASEVPACRPHGEFLALPEPLRATFNEDGSWSFEDPSLSVLLYPDECLFTLVQQLDLSDPVAGDYHDQLSYIALTHPAVDVWTGSGRLRRTYADDTTCENRISGVSVTLTWP